MQYLKLRVDKTLSLNLKNKLGFARLVCVLALAPSLIFISACGENTSSIQTSNINKSSNPQSNTAPEFQTSEWKPGGDTTVTPISSIHFDTPANNLSMDEKIEFHSGKALAQQPWIKAPTITDSRDGLGPIYNARTCMACHVNGGKGSTPIDSQQELFSTLVRLSVKPNDSSTHKQLLKKAGVVPHPMYGDQLQTQSTSLSHQLRHVPSAKSLKHDVAPEAYVNINWQTKTVSYPDGSKVTLKKPSPVFKNIGYGPLQSNHGKNTMIALRTAPSIHGMGLIELIPQSQINALADETDKNQDGISGKVNQVWNTETKKTEPGRFGLKANKPTLTMTVAGAFANDLGISNPLFKSQPCTALQTTCLAAANGNDKNGVELNQKQLDLAVNFNRNLAPVKARNLTDKSVRQGRELFYQSGCQNCHKPSFKTAESTSHPHLANQTIWPYSDFLLHDLGEALSDNRPDFNASAQEWRTPPLWGIGVQAKVNGSHALLHDGRANTVEEAILWHGGEAQISKHAFMQLNKDQRDLLILFVNAI